MAISPKSIFKVLDGLYEALRRPLSEMPHITYDERLGSRKYGTLDFQIEKYPLDPAEKTRLLRALQTTGVVAQADGRWVFFGPDDLSSASKKQVASLPHLPDFWEMYLINIE